MTPDERRERLSELARLPADADACEDIRRVFLPLPRHSLALRPENFIIRGDRGAGKTALFKFLDRTRETPGLLARVFPNSRIEDVTWLDGFSASARHPEPGSLKHGAGSGERAVRLFWSAHLACRLIEEGRGAAGELAELHVRWRADRNDVAGWLSLAQAATPALTQWLDRLDAGLENPLCVTYDHLDKIAIYEPELRQRYVEGLLALWSALELRYRKLRPKIFLREDIFQTSLGSFADSSKLRARSVSLDWDKEGLFRVLIRHAASLHEGLRGWIERGARGIPLRDDPVLGPMPPPLPGTGAVSQQSFVEHLAGPLMGDGTKKGYTYRWIPNRLQDANERVFPRTLLSLIAHAAEHALRTETLVPHEQLLAPADLIAGLRGASLDRISDLEEEHKFIARLRHLEERTMLMDRYDVEAALSQPDASPDGQETDGKKIVDELVRIGVLSVHPRDRIDVPDLYRYGLQIKRKGGVAHPV